MFNFFIKHLTDAFKNNKKVFIIYVLISIAICTLIILFCFRVKPTPTLSDDPYSVDNVEYIENIIIEDFDEYAVGILHNHKYYHLQSCVFLQDESFVGEYIGKTEGSILNHISGNVFEFHELGSNQYGNAEVYKLKTDDPWLAENILLLQDVYSEGINGYWVCSPESLPNIYIPDLIKKNITGFDFFPDTEDLSESVFISADDFNIPAYTATWQRVNAADGDFYSNCLPFVLAIRDGSGLVYALSGYYNTVVNATFLVSNNYNNLVYVTSNDLFPYLYNYVVASHSDSSDTTEAPEIETFENSETTNISE